jgi:outer membrane protein
MHKTLALSMAAALLIGSHLPASAQTKIGTVDMNQIFNSFYRTKEAETRLNAARAKAKEELETKMGALKKDEDALRKLQEELASPALSKEAKEAKQKDFEEKRAKFGPAMRELREFQTAQEKQLQEQAVRMRNGIVEEINKVVGEKVKAEQFDLVLDRSGNSLNGVPVAVFARDSLDFSDEVIKDLNKNKPKDAPAGGAGDGSLKLESGAEKKN